MKKEIIEYFCDLCELQMNEVNEQISLKTKKFSGKDFIWVNIHIKSNARGVRLTEICKECQIEYLGKAIEKLKEN